MNPSPFVLSSMTHLPLHNTKKHKNFEASSRVTSAKRVVTLLTKFHSSQIQRSNTHRTTPTEEGEQHHPKEGKRSASQKWRWETHHHPPLGSCCPLSSFTFFGVVALSPLRPLGGAASSPPLKWCKTCCFVRLWHRVEIENASLWEEGNAPLQRMER